MAGQYVSFAFYLDRHWHHCGGSQQADQAIGNWKTARWLKPVTGPRIEITRNVISWVLCSGSNRSLCYFGTKRQLHQLLFGGFDCAGRIGCNRLELAGGNSASAVN